MKIPNLKVIKPECWLLQGFLGQLVNKIIKIWKEV